MSQEKNSMYVVVVLIALLGVILSCCAGMFGGFVAGSWQAGKVSSSIWRGLQHTPPPYRVPTPDESDLFPPMEEYFPEELPSTEAPSVDEMVPEAFWEAGYSAGALVLEVNPASPAQNARLRAGDIIVAVGEKALTSGDMLSNLIGAYKPGDKVELKFWRNKRERSVEVTLIDNPDKAGQAYLGVFYVPVPQSEEAEEPNDLD